MEIKVGINARRRRVRVVCGKANGLRSIGCYSAADGVLQVEESIKCGFGNIFGDGSLVEGIVLAPEVLPGLFVGGLDGADLDG